MGRVASAITKRGLAKGLYYLPDYARVTYGGEPTGKIDDGTHAGVRKLRANTAEPSETTEHRDEKKKRKCVSPQKETQPAVCDARKRRRVATQQKNKKTRANKRSR